MSSLKINPILKHGMVVHKQKDPRRGYCYYTFNVNRLVEGKRAICFLEMVETAEKLGLEIKPHWTTAGQAQGFFGVIGLKYHGPFDNIDDVEVDPVVEKFLKDGISNKYFKNLLMQENE